MGQSYYELELELRRALNIATVNFYRNNTNMVYISKLRLMPLFDELIRAWVATQNSLCRRTIQVDIQEVMIVHYYLVCVCVVLLRCRLIHLVSPSY